MNLVRLFEIQDGLNFHIKKERGLLDRDLIEEDILGLQVKIGELADRQRTWKYWTEDQKPYDEVYTCIDKDMNIIYLPQHPTYADKVTTTLKVESFLLDSFVSAISFLINISLQLGIKAEDFNLNCKFDQKPIAKQFNNLFAYTNVIYAFLDDEAPFSISREDMSEAVSDLFTELYEMKIMKFGFSDEDVEGCYLEKNEQMHEKLNYVKGEII